MVLQAIRYSSSPPSLQILDQLALPHHTTYTSIPNAASAWHAIRSMSVRGAPAIAIVAALSVAVEICSGDGPTSGTTKGTYETGTEDWIGGEAEVDVDGEKVKKLVVKRLRHLVTSRPTAVNLKDAVGKLEAIVGDAVDSGERAEGVRRAYVRAAEKMLEDDVRDNERIGEEGAKWIQKSAGGGQVTVLTHCNTGSLATAGYGTALGIVRSLRAGGILRHVYYTETRPYNQGSRLTGFELLHDKIPATLIADSMSAALFRLKGQAEKIAAVIVGADRVAANGDTANKIGTYGLAVLARHHNIKFLVAAPRTTIDLATHTGEDIVIEERPQEEMLELKGPTVSRYDQGMQQVDTDQVKTISIAALGTKTWNPAFDVTPANLIDAIVTETGVVEKVNGAFDLQSIFRQ